MTDDCWSLPELGWPEIRVHPVYLVDPDAMEVLRLWRLWRSGDGPLPEAGGMLDQPAALMASFEIMTEAAAAMERVRARER